MRFLLAETDVNMGNEDRWTLIISDDKTEVTVEHWCSHRVGKYDFKPGTEKLTLKELQRKKNQLYEKAIKYLHENGIDFNETDVEVKN